METEIYLKLSEAVDKFVEANARGFTTDQIVHFLNRLPKYEVPVIEKCEECKYYDPEEFWCRLHDIEMYGNDFCSDVIPKDNDEEELVDFASLKCGDMFKFGDNVFMKSNPVRRGDGRVLSNAINLSNGQSVRFTYSDGKVCRVSKEVVIR